MSMQEVECQACGRRREVNLYYLDSGMATGEFTKGSKLSKRTDMGGTVLDFYEVCYFDVCKACTKAATSQPGDPTMLQAARIKYKWNLLREMRPDLTSDECRREAIREEFDPNREPNPAFRRFLLDRGEKDDVIDQTAHHILEEAFA
jgi:hypothetical protein